ncbi:MAG TPA: SDR family oxidoreductase [Pseudogracilibacillus sp.]|nr:SDR family oxidoreductase [Pseudogracilibacillus sp.]
MNKTAIITGASSGIGLGVARKLINEDYNVVLAARSKEKIEMHANELNELNKGKALAIQTDVMDQKAVEEMVKHTIDVFGTVDVYVNNAGQMLSASVTDGQVEEWERMIDVNIKGVLYGINAVLPHMKDRETGHIINISSVSGQEVTKMSTVYSATKFAVRAISIGLEKELARTGVRVTNISPGMVDTDLISVSTDRKPLDVSDIAEAIIYALKQPSYVNVNEITVRPV